MNEMSLELKKCIPLHSGIEGNEVVDQIEESTLQHPQMQLNIQMIN